MIEKYVKKVQRTLAMMQKVSFDYDGTLSTPQGKALAKRLITQGYPVYIISARSKDKIKPMLEVASELGIRESNVYATGSNKAKVEKIIELNIARHYDNNPDVVDALKKENIKSILVNYGD